MITDEAIYERSGKTTYRRGCEYFAAGKVKRVHRRDSGTFEAEVQGSQLYYVELKLDSLGELAHEFCDCPAFEQYEGSCKHIVAVLKKIQRDWGSLYTSPRSAEIVPLKQEVNNAGMMAVMNFHRPNDAIHRLLAHFRAKPTALTSGGLKQQARLEVVFNFCKDRYRGLNSECWLDFSIGVDRLYVLKDIPAFLRAFSDGSEIAYGKQFSFRLSTTEFDDLSMKIIQMMQRVYDEERERASWSFDTTNGATAFQTGRRFRLTRSTLDEFFAISSGGTVMASLQFQPVQPVPVCEGRPPVHFSVDAGEDGLRLACEGAEEDFYGLDADFRHVVHYGKIYRVDLEFSQVIGPLLRCFGESRQAELTLPAAVVSDFASNLLPTLESVGEVAIAEAVRDKMFWEPLEAVVFLDRYE